MSKDGKWRSLPKVPGLIQYVSTGTYFARAKVQGKPIRKSLETDVFTTAKLKLPDMLKRFHKPKPGVGTFAEARALYEADLPGGPRTCNPEQALSSELHQSLA